MYQVTNRYEDDPTIFYGFKHRESYPSNHIDASKVASIGGERRIVAGSFITTTNRILPRSKLVSPYTSGQSILIVENPWAFQIGDIIHAIGNLTESAAADNASFNTPVPIGTVTSIDQRVAKSLKRLTITSPAVGNIYSLKFNKGSTEARFTAVNTNVVDIYQGLLNAIHNMYSDFSIFDYLNITLVSNSYLQFDHKENNCPYLSEVSQTGTGTSTLVEQNAVGGVYITPIPSNPSFAIGQKVGTIADRPVGVTTREYLVSDIRQNPIVADVPIYNAGTLVKSALPYIDGQILSVLPKLSVYPAFSA